MRGMSQTRGLRAIKSPRSVGVSSVPKAQRSTYLELYMLRNERDRVEKEISVLDKRRNAAKRQLDTVCSRITKLQKEAQHTKQENPARDETAARPLSTMPVNY